MSITPMEARPPSVRFEQRTEEDREASIKAGGIITRDVNFAVIRQAGSKDTVEMKAEDFLAQWRQHSKTGLVPVPWYEHFANEYERWKAGQDVSEYGFSVRNWPGASKAQIENLIAVGVRTVEDVAAMNEPTMNRLGMGYRELKRKAALFLEDREANKGAEKVVALEAALENEKVRSQGLEKAVAELSAKLEALTHQLAPAKRRA